MGTFFRLSLSPIAQLATAVVTAATLLVATRSGQFQGVAGYSAGLSLGAIAAVMAGGGTTLVYLSGSEDDQRSVRRVRMTWVAPAVLCVSVLAALLMPMHTELNAWDVLLGGLVALLNNFAEIETSFLKRNLQTTGLFFVDVTTRLLALAALLFGVPFALSTFIGTVARQVLLQVMARHDPSRSSVLQVAFSAALRRAYDPRLMGLTASYVIIDRSTFVAVPLIAGATLAGVYSSILSLTQAASGLLVSGLQTVLAVRSSDRASAAQVRPFEIATLALAAFGCLVVDLMSPWILSAIGVEQSQLNQNLLIILSLAIPLGVATRLIHFRCIASGKRHAALAMGVSAAAVLVLVAMTSIVLGSIELMASALMAGEAAGLAVGITLGVRSRLRGKWNEVSDDRELAEA